MVSKDSKVEQKELPLHVDALLEIERVRLDHLIRGMTGFHVRGTERHRLSVQTGSSKHKNLCSATSKNVFLTMTAIAKEFLR